MSWQSVINLSNQKFSDSTILNTCSIEDCDASIKHKGLCDYHYQRYRSKGDFPLHPSKRAEIVKICAVNDCGNKVQAVTLCSKHCRSYHRWKAKNLISDRDGFVERLANK